MTHKILRRITGPTWGNYIRRFAVQPAVWVMNVGAYGLYRLLPEHSWDQDRPIFIIGCPRSGTTVFVDMFAQHRSLANWTEAGQLFARDYYNKNADHLLEEKDIKGFDVARIKTFIKAFVTIKGKPRFVNKHPRNSLRIRYLKAIYPDALFIHVIRDGRAVASSLVVKTRKERFRWPIPYGGFCKPPEWRQYLEDESDLRQFGNLWVGIVDYVRQTAAETLTAQDYFEVKYEDFCDRPHEILKEVDEFCGLPLDQRDYTHIPEKFELRNYKWKDSLEPQEVDELEQVMATCLQSLGYEASR